jgi:hypothetical protein
VKKILIISEHIFPKQTPRAYRATELAIQLAKVGYQVTLCAVLGSYDYAIFQEKYNLRVKNLKLNWQYAPNTSDLKSRRYFIDKLLNKLFHKFFEYPLIEFYFKIPQLINKIEKQDVLISIAVPHQIHWGCARAKLLNPSSFPKTWIADSGDPYFINIGNEKYKNKFAKKEKLVFEKCNYYTVPFDKAKENYKKLDPRKLKVIPQGFNFEIPDINNYKPLNKIPTFIYCGSFYADFRNPIPFLDYLSKLSFDFKFVVYTLNFEMVQDFVPKLRNKIQLKNYIPREELLKELSKYDFLINFENVELPGLLPSKLIDYAIADRPILSLNTSDLNTQLVSEFLKGNYEKRLLINNLENYQINNVAQRFVDLF